MRWAWRPGLDAGAPPAFQRALPAATCRVRAPGGFQGRRGSPGSGRVSAGRQRLKGLSTIFWSVPGS